MSLFSWLFHRKRKPTPPPAPKPPIVVVPLPTPIPVPERRRALSGLYVYSGWQKYRAEFGAVPRVMCVSPRPWDTLRTDDRNMALDKYDEADPAILATRIKWWVTGGVDFVVYQIEHAHEHTNAEKRARGRPILADPLIMSHNADNHPAECAVRFCVDWWDVMASAGVWGNDSIWQEMIGNGWTADDVRTSHRIFARSVATRYMTKASYLTVGGRPVLVRGNPQELQFYFDHFGIEPAEIVRIWRETIFEAIGKAVYIVATAASEDVRPKLKQWGFDCLTEYLLHGRGWAHTMDVYRYWRARDVEQCRRDGLGYWPPATVGYDGTAWETPESVAGYRHIPTGAEFTEHIREVRQVSLDNFDLSNGISVTYADNEIGEGGIWQPMAAGQLHDGDEMLRAHARAVAVS